MNPIMILIVIIGAIVLWFLGSFLWRPIGRFFTKRYKNAIGKINEDEENNNMEVK